MTFTSLEFYFFLPVVYLVYHFAGERLRIWWLLAASYFLYASLKVPYLPAVLGLVTVMTYCCGRSIGRSRGEGGKRALLWCGISFNVLVLLGMKYLPFLAANLNALGGLLGNGLQVPVPPSLVSIGVSFFVFQAIGYLVDISLELSEPEQDFGVFALSLAFFPKLLQGPIERSGEFTPYFRVPYSFSSERVRAGLILIACGLFKKMVLADRLALYVNPVYDNVHHYSGLVLIVATYLYALQIYFDFSGYTDMAIGSAGVFGIPLTQNFNSPYLATSVGDFWRRWHITFSRWILDYIFKPLQMLWRDHGSFGTALALLVTFLVSGIWHGASWCFIVWGVLHGVYLASSVFWKPYQKKLYRLLGVRKGRLLTIWQTIVTFNLVCFGWIFFRAGSLGDAWYVVTHLFSGVKLARSTLLMYGADQLAVLITVLLFQGALKLFYDRTIIDVVTAKPLWCRWLFYWMIIIVIVLLGESDPANKFVYFQF